MQAKNSLDRLKRSVQDDRRARSAQARSSYIDPHKHWPFKSHGKGFEVVVPILVSETDETQAWILLHKTPARRASQEFSTNVLVMTGGPLVVKDKATGDWVRKLEFHMAKGENHTIVLRRDPEWQIPTNAALDFVYHGTLIVEMIDIGDSRGVDIEIERGLLSVIRSSMSSFSTLVSPTVISAIASILTLIAGEQQGGGLVAHLSASAIMFISVYMGIWIALNFVQRPKELHRRLNSNIDYLHLIEEEIAKETRKEHDP